MMMKEVPQRGCRGLYFWIDWDVEWVAVLVCVNRLVLRTVVHEHALDLGVATHEPDVGDDQEDAKCPVDDDEQERVATDQVLDPIGGECGTDDEDRQRCDDRDDHRQDDLALADLLAFLASLLG